MGYPSPVHLLGVMRKTGQVAAPTHGVQAGDEVAYLGQAGFENHSAHCLRGGW